MSGNTPDSRQFKVKLGVQHVSLAASAHLL